VCVCMCACVCVRVYVSASFDELRFNCISNGDDCKSLPCFVKCFFFVFNVCVHVRDYSLSPMELEVLLRVFR
jgi:hypothetical protein